MTKIEFEITDNKAARWERVLQDSFFSDLSPDRMKKITLRDLISLAVHAYIAQEAQIKASEAMAELDKSMEEE